MAQPEISWFELNNTTPVTQWPIGTVDAGNTSPDKTFLIWNNRGKGVAVSDATDCTITTKDPAGGEIGELVENTWIKVRVDTMSETGFTPIGKGAAKSLKAGGTAPAGTIRGTTNDGTTTNAKENFAQVTLHAHPTATATAGNVDFLLRLQYRYT